MPLSLYAGKAAKFSFGIAAKVSAGIYPTDVRDSPACSQSREIFQHR